MSDCPFCARIERGEFDGGDRCSVTFEPLNPVTPGHRLFVSRAHVVNALERPDITGHVMRYAAEWTQGHLLNPCNLITSAGVEATQSVFHLHIHLVPRREGDGLALPWTGQKERAETEVAHYKRLFTLQQQARILGRSIITCGSGWRGSYYGAVTATYPEGSRIARSDSWRCHHDHPDDLSALECALGEVSRLAGGGAYEPCSAGPDCRDEECIRDWARLAP